MIVTWRRNLLRTACIFGMMGFPLSGADASTLANNLLAYYAFDGNWKDSTGNNPDAVPFGAANISSVDKLPYAYSTGAADLGTSVGFGGAGANTDHLEIPAGHNLNFGSGAFTIVTWVAFNGHGTNRQPYGSSTSGTGFRTTVGSNGNWSLVYDTDTQAAQTSTQHLLHFQSNWNSSDTNRWYFTATVVNPVAGTVTGYGGRATLRRNGAADAGIGLLTQNGTTITPGGSINNAGPFLIGNTFNATYDEFAAWNRALTLTEIQQLYNNGLGYDLSTEISTVPEPSTWVLAALGLTGLGLFACRSRERNGASRR